MFVQILLMFTLCIAFVKWKLTYWSRRSVPCIDTWSIWGNMNNPFTNKEFIAITFMKIYQKFKKAGKQHAGFYALLSPQYVPIDLDIVMRIFRSDFDHFEDRGLYYNEKDDPVSAHMLNIEGEKWKTLRAKVSPAFTRAKIRSMFNIIIECANPINLILENQKVVDIKNLSSRFTIDVIGSCGFGIECNSLKSDNSDFLHLFNISNESNSSKLLIDLVSSYPKLGHALGIKLINKQCSKFFTSVAESTSAYRRSKAIKRNDVFQALMDLDNKLTVNEIAAQCYIFFKAGFETSASTIAYCMYELSRNPEIQEKTRKEILLVTSKYKGEITFEAIEEMKYLQQVVYETLRKYPPGPIISRICTKDYKVPNHDLVIKKDTRIMVSVLGIHHDEEYYPDPEKFDPDRFSEQNVQNIQKCSYLPFGDGPRICIGKLIGIIEVKTCLCALLKDYVFAVNPKVKHPLRWVASGFTLRTQDPIWLDIQKIST